MFNANITFDLAPENNNFKSFYGKARVSYDSKRDTLTLTSYTTEVCRIDGYSTAPHFSKMWDGYSATTGRHIWSFLRQFAPYVCDEYNSSKAKSFPKWWATLPVSA